MRTQQKKIHFLILFLLLIVILFAAHFYSSKNTQDSTEIALDADHPTDNQATKENNNPTPDPQPIDEPDSPAITTKTGSADSAAEKFMKARSVEKSRTLARTETIHPTREQLRAHPILSQTRWQLWLKTRADFLNENSEAAPGPELTRLNNYIIVADNSNIPDLTEFHKMNPQVVYDQRRKQVGILTGTIRINTDRRDLLEKDLATAQAEITDAFDTIETYFIQSTNDVFDLQSLYLFLRQQSYIKNVELEILSRTYEKK